MLILSFFGMVCLGFAMLCAPSCHYLLSSVNQIIVSIFVVKRKQCWRGDHHEDKNWARKKRRFTSCLPFSSSCFFTSPPPASSLLSLLLLICLVAVWLLSSWRYEGVKEEKAAKRGKCRNPWQRKVWCKTRKERKYYKRESKNHQPEMNLMNVHSSLPQTTSSQLEKVHKRRCRRTTMIWQDSETGEEERWSQRGTGKASSPSTSALIIFGCLLLHLQMSRTGQWPWVWWRRGRIVQLHTSLSSNLLA